MSARTAEISRVKSPIKKQIRHLDSHSQKNFNGVLNKVVKRLRSRGFKLTLVTKSYRKNGTHHSDNFWRKEEKVGDVKIVWICKLTSLFRKSFEFRFDLDFWFDFFPFFTKSKSRPL